MRVTNMMIQNNAMLNISKNNQQVSKLYTQMATGKKIVLPSDDPIIAARSLRFSASISATEQYQRNTEQAISWSSTTATAFENVAEQMNTLSELVTKGANDTLSISERQDIAISMQACLDEISMQMNTSYTGRYVFSGYRTDEPMVLLESSDKAYNINQTLSYDDIMQTKSYWKADEQTEASMEDITCIRLPYANAKNITLNNEDGSPSGYTVEHRSVDDTTDPYSSIGPDDVVYIDETGELLIGENVQDDLIENDMNINYDKEGFLKDELNPVVNFDCTERDSGITETYPTAATTDPHSGLIISSDSADKLVQKTDQYGDLVFDEAGEPVYISYTMEDQDMMSYELSYKTQIQINSLGKDVLTDNLYADLSTSIDKIMNIEISSESSLRLKYSDDPYNYTGDELDEAIEEQIGRETTVAQTVMQDEFASMLDKITQHTEVISNEHTDLGARQGRMDVIQTRLEDELLNLETLNSENEDLDYVQATADALMLEAVYQASLSVIGKISQTSLVNYI